jgi:hypothetical protein
MTIIWVFNIEKRANPTVSIISDHFIGQFQMVQTHQVMEFTPLESEREVILAPTAILNLKSKNRGHYAKKRSVKE